MTTLTAKPTWAAMYDENGVGGLIAAGLSPLGGFGRFLTVLMALSIVANNIPNIYSMSLTVQIFGKGFQAIPRLFITILGTIAYIVLAIAGASHFNSWLDTLLVILSYWLCIFFVRTVPSPPPISLVYFLYDFTYDPTLLFPRRPSSLRNISSSAVVNGQTTTSTPSHHPISCPSVSPPLSH